MNLLLQEMQGLLSGLYDVGAAHNVYDYLITDAAQVSRLQGCVGNPASEELLLLSESDEGIELSLYVDATVLDRLVRNCPFRSLCETNLEDFCTALEGVSHFQYLVWSAERSREVSLLELELQAEVDKYAIALQLMLRQRNGHFPSALLGRLFDQVSFLPHLCEEERRRYIEANRYAARFCQRLEERFLRSRDVRPEAMLMELRRFYRLTHHAKLRHCGD
jgi:hypothetical protein